MNRYAKPIALTMLASLACLPLSAARAETATPPTGDKPLAAVLKLVETSQARLERDVRDYTCRIVRRERIGGELRPFDFIDAKIRRPQSIADGAANNLPFSVYVHFTKPASMAGREVLYVEGRNAGKMLVRRGGKRMAYVTTYLDPESSMALRDNRHPISSIGFGRLLTKIAADVRDDMDRPGVVVRFYNAKINNRPCTRVAIIHPEPGPGFTYHRTELFLDKELGLPAAFATYNWPDAPGQKPKLVEQYVYDRVQLNVGLTDADFERSNPEYGFLKSDAQ